MEDLTSPRVLRSTLARYGLVPRKRWGQNFLIDANLRDKIVAAAALTPGDLAVEVGPGPGALTPSLLAADTAVLAIEVDTGLARVLMDRLAELPGEHTVIVGDVLKLDLAEAVNAAGFTGRPCVAVANLPYYITTPVIFHLLETDLPWKRMVLLLQREVAERITAAPGSKEYGLLTVMIGSRARAEIVTTLPPAVFWPPPQVHSALVRLTLPGPFKFSTVEGKVLSGLARAAFGQRRKTLAKACREWAGGFVPENGFIRACAEVGIDPGRRGEDLSIAEFVALSRIISRIARLDGTSGKEI